MKPVLFVLADGTEVQLRRRIGFSRGIECEPVPDDAPVVTGGSITTRRDNTIEWLDYRILGRRSR